MGFKLFMQPLFCQQLGPFSSVPLKDHELKHLLSKLPLRAPYFNLNISTKINDQILVKHLNPKAKINQILSLKSSMEEIDKNLNRSVKRNVKKGLSIFSDLEEKF